MPRLEDRYELHERIATGGMGEVWEAVDLRLDRRVAVKTLRGESGADPERQVRFERETLAVARLGHPGIVRIFDVGAAAFGEGQAERPFLVMELLEGTTLRDRVARCGPCEPAAALRLAARVAEALQHAHGQGVLHRDITPANVMLRDGDLADPVLIDFGLVRGIGSPTSAESMDAVLGTPVYSAPEQAFGAPEEVDERADLYGIGATLYELLTGRPPFEAPTLLALLRRIEDEAVADTGLGEGVDRALQRLLAKDPAQRPATARELAEELRALADRAAAGAVAGEVAGGVDGAAAGAMDETRSGERPVPPVPLAARRGVVWGAVGGLVGLVLGLVLGFWLAVPVGLPLLLTHGLGSWTGSPVALDRAVWERAFAISEDAEIPAEDRALLWAGDVDGFLERAEDRLSPRSWALLQLCSAPALRRLGVPGLGGLELEPPPALATDAFARAAFGILQGEVDYAFAWLDAARDADELGVDPVAVCMLELRALLAVEEDGFDPVRARRFLDGMADLRALGGPWSGLGLCELLAHRLEDDAPGGLPHPLAESPAPARSVVEALLATAVWDLERAVSTLEAVETWPYDDLEVASQRGLLRVAERLEEGEFADGELAEAFEELAEEVDLRIEEDGEVPRLAVWLLAAQQLWSGDVAEARTAWSEAGGWGADAPLALDAGHELLEMVRVADGADPWWWVAVRDFQLARGEVEPAERAMDALERAAESWRLEEPESAEELDRMRAHNALHRAVLRIDAAPDRALGLVVEAFELGLPVEEFEHFEELEGLAEAPELRRWLR